MITAQRSQRWNRLLTLTHLFSLVVVSYLWVTLSIFSSTDSVNLALKQSGGYNHITEIVKSEIISRFPPELNDKVLRKALAINLLNNFVTPQFIERVAQPLLKAGAFVIAQPTSIEDNKVVVDTQPYRERIASESAEIQIPETLKPVVQNIASAIPDQLTLVDLEKRPNSVLGFLVKGKEWYQYINTLNWIFLIIVASTLVLLIYYNYRALKTLFFNIGWGYLTAGLIVLLLSFMLPFSTANFIPENTDPVIGNELNLMVNDALTYYFTLTRKFGWLYLVIGIIGLLLWKIRYMNSLQQRFDQLVGGNQSKPDTVSSTAKSQKNAKKR